VALSVAHTCPQAPQLFASPATSISHPSSALGAAGVSQSAKPDEQVGTHSPALQLVESAFALEQV
jgi:hypothetical protein